MRIVVKFFARYRETLGMDEMTLDGDFACVDAVRQFLLLRESTQVLAEQNLMCARNEDLCSLTEPLADGDEVAFFPAVTGG